MLFLAKRVLTKYKPLIMQMWAHQLANEIANANITTLLDVQILLGFHCIMPLLELLHGLIKMVQTRTFMLSILLKF
jgi:hypothetical protein